MYHVAQHLALLLFGFIFGSSLQQGVVAFRQRDWLSLAACVAMMLMAEVYALYVGLPLWLEHSG